MGELEGLYHPVPAQPLSAFQIAPSSLHGPACLEHCAGNVENEIIL